MTDTQTDVVVIGGGIAGTSAAYFLAREGRRVTLFEKDGVAAHASGFAFGVLLPRIVPDPSDPLDALVELSLNLHKQVTDELATNGAQLRTEKASVLLALDDLEASQYSALYRSRDDLIGDVRWLEYGELSHIEARISPDVRGGLYLGESAEINPGNFCRAMWAAAEAEGARLVPSEVDSVKPDGAGVRVTGGDETVSADSAIVAAGPWTRSLMSDASLNVPVDPLKGQILRLKAPGPPIKVSLWYRSNYAGSKPEGLLWCGTTEERVGFDEQTTPDARDRILASAQKVLPFLSEAEVEIHTACLRPVTPDGIPVLGQLPELPQIVVASGGGRNGIVLGPSLGKVAADIATGSPVDIDLAGFDPTRFGG